MRGTERQRNGRGVAKEGGVGSSQMLTSTGSLLCGPARSPGFSANVAPKARDVVAGRDPEECNRHTRTHASSSQGSRDPGPGAALATHALKEAHRRLHTGAHGSTRDRSREHSTRDHGRGLTTRAGERACCLRMRGTLQWKQGTHKPRSGQYPRSCAGEGCCEAP